MFLSSACFMHRLVVIRAAAAAGDSEEDADSSTDTDECQDAQDAADV